ncbi:MAG: basic secretory protein-like protein [Fimbriimonadaceae bacterium]
MSLIASLCASIVLSQQKPDLDRYVYPRTPEMACPPVEIDVSDFPESEAWAMRAKRLIENWYGPLTALLATDGRDPVTHGLTGKAYKSNDKIRLVIKKEISAPAWAAGGEITVSGKWITQHPDDLGMIIHELTHVVQAYPDFKGKPGWLVEGIADYTRWWKYEPELHATRGRTKPDFSNAKYTDSYRTTAVWLAFISKKYDMRLVPSLDLEMRSGRDPMPIFEKLTGKSADALWDEFAKESG